jgi:hypothetical protein
MLPQLDRSCYESQAGRRAGRQAKHTCALTVTESCSAVGVCVHMAMSTRIMSCAAPASARDACPAGIRRSKRRRQTLPSAYRVHPVDAIRPGNDHCSHGQLASAGRPQPIPTHPCK